MFFLAHRRRVVQGHSGGGAAAAAAQGGAGGGEGAVRWVGLALGSNCLAASGLVWHGKHGSCCLLRLVDMASRLQKLACHLPHVAAQLAYLGLPCLHPAAADTTPGSRWACSGSAVSSAEVAGVHMTCQRRCVMTWPGSASPHHAALPSCACPCSHPAALLNRSLVLPHPVVQR